MSGEKMRRDEWRTCSYFNPQASARQASQGSTVRIPKSEIEPAGFLFDLDQISMSELEVERVTEFDCIEPGRHIIGFCGLVGDQKLCAVCVALPGWFKDERTRKVLDPDHDRARSGTSHDRLSRSRLGVARRPATRTCAARRLFHG